MELSERIDKLYKKMFEAEEEGNQEKVDRLRTKIKKLLKEGSDAEQGVCWLCGTERDWENDGETCPECGHDHIIYKEEWEEREKKGLDEIEIREFKETYLDSLNEKDKVKIEFFYKTRKKTFHKNLRDILIEGNDVSDIDLAMVMTSMLTHSLIEMKKEDKKVYNNLDVYTLTETVSKFLSGELSGQDAISVLKEHYGEHLKTRLIKE